MNKKNLDRIKELEEEATKRFIEYSDWDEIIECLDEDEQIEYKKLIEMWRENAK